MKKIISLFLIFLIFFTCGCSRNTYTATFQDSDGNILKVIEVPMDEAPVYEGIPEKASDDLYDYSFYSWDKELTAANEDTTYTSIYVSSIKNDEDEVIFVDDLELDELRGDVNNELLDDSMISESFFVTFLDDDYKTILQKTEFQYGSTPYFSAGSPSSKVVGDYLYTFVGWDKSFSVVKSEQTYVAVYKKEKLQSNTSSSSSSSSSSGQAPQHQGNYVTTTTEKVLDYTVTLIAYDLSNNQEGGGTFIGAGSYKAGSRASIEAIANQGMHFVRWNDNDISTTKSFTVTSNVTYTAYFEKDNETSKSNYRVVVKTSDVQGGIVSISPNRTNNMYEEGESVTISASAKTGYKFNGWIDHNSVVFADASQFQKEFNVTRDDEYTALFTKDVQTEVKKEKENGKVTINAVLNNTNVAFVRINNVLTSSTTIDKGSDVSVEVSLTSSSAKFLGWSYKADAGSLFSTSQLINIPSIQSDTTITGFISYDGPSDTISGSEDATPQIEVVSAAISSNPSNACSFIVDGSTNVPSSFELGHTYIISFTQNADQLIKYKFNRWEIGSSKYYENTLNYSVTSKSTQQIVAYFDTIKEEKEPTTSIDINNINKGNVITFNNYNDKYLVLDKYIEGDKTIGKLIPIGTSLLTKYSNSSLKVNNLLGFDNINILFACSKYVDAIPNENLKNHLHKSNIDFYNYLSADDTNSYNVHKSVIPISSSPSSFINLNLSCYPLGLDDFDKFYTSGNIKGLYCLKDLENFLSLTVNGNDIWLKDLISFGSDSLDTGIYVSKTGINTTHVATDKYLLPVLLVELDDTLEASITSQSLAKTNKYQIFFSANNSECGSVEVSNNSYSNLYYEGEEVNFRFNNNNPDLYTFLNWNDGDVNAERTIIASKNTNYIAKACAKINDFSKNFDIIPYIKSNGTQFINTGYFPKANTNVSLQFDPIDDYTDSYVNKVSGVKYGALDFVLSMIYTKGSKDNKNFSYSLSVNGEEVSSSPYVLDYKNINISSNKMTITNLNSNTDTFNLTNSNSYSGIEYPLYIFASNENGSVSGPSKIKLYGCQIYEDSILVHNFIPVCYKSTTESNKKYGLFDTIEYVYYPSSNINGFDGYSKNDKLFNKYTQLDYLQNNGNSFVDTGTLASNDIGIYAKIMPLSYSNANYIGSCNDNLIIGSSLDTSKDDYAALYAKYNSSNPVVHNYYSTNHNTSLFASTITYDFLSSRSFNFLNHSNNNFLTYNDSNKNNPSGSNNIFIGKANGDDTNVAPARYYQVVMSNGRDIIHNYYPVEDTDNNIGFLDIITGQFINLSSSSFIKPKQISGDLIDISTIKVLSRVIGDGSQFIDTGVKPASTTGLRLNYIPLEFYDSFYIGANDGTNTLALGGNLGSDDSNNSKRSSFVYIGKSGSEKYYFADKDYVIETSSPKPIVSEYNYSGQKFTYNYSSGSLNFKSVSVNDDSYFNNFGNILIGKANDTNKGPAIFYSAAISNDNITSHFYVPAKKGTDIGFYDVVDCKFIKSNSNFIDGSFKDDVQCTIQTKVESPVVLNRSIYNGNNLINSVTGTDTVTCSFLSTLYNESIPFSDDASNKYHILDKWSDTNRPDQNRKIIAYLPVSYGQQTYNANSISYVKNYYININIIDPNRNKLGTNVAKAVYITDNNTSNGNFYPGQKVKVKIDTNINAGYYFSSWSSDSYDSSNLSDATKNEREFIVNEDTTKNNYTAIVTAPLKVTIKIDQSSAQYPFDVVDVTYYDIHSNKQSLRISQSNNESSVLVCKESCLSFKVNNHTNFTFQQDSSTTKYSNNESFDSYKITHDSILTFKFNNNLIKKGDVISLDNFNNTQSFKWKKDSNKNATDYNNVKNNYFKVVKVYDNFVMLMDIGTVCPIMPHTDDEWKVLDDAVDKDVYRQKSSNGSYFPRGKDFVIDIIANYHMDNYYKGLKDEFKKYILSPEIFIDTYDLTNLKDSSTYGSIKTWESSGNKKIFYLSLNDIFDYLSDTFELDAVDPNNFKVKNTTLTKQLSDDAKDKIFDLFGFSQLHNIIPDSKDRVSSFALRDHLIITADKKDKKVHRYVGDDNFVVERVTESGKKASITNANQKYAIYNYIRFSFNYDLSKYLSNGYNIGFPK